MAFRLKEALEGGLRLYAARLSESLTEKGAVASGRLGESIEIRVPTARKGSYTAQVLMNDYWEFVDQGRSAGKRPPMQSIIDWLKYPAVQDRFTFGREDRFNNNAIQSIAFNIAKKIGEQGTKGNNFATEVFESRISQDLQDRLADAIENDLENTIDEIAQLMKE